MGRELANYRDILERLDEAYPGRELLTREEVAAFLGVNPRTVKRRYDFPAGRVTKTMVARMVAQ